MDRENTPMLRRVPTRESFTWDSDRVSECRDLPREMSMKATGLGIRRRVRVNTFSQKLDRFWKVPSKMMILFKEDGISSKDSISKEASISLSQLDREFGIISMESKQRLFTNKKRSKTKTNLKILMSYRLMISFSINSKMKFRSPKKRKKKRKMPRRKKKSRPRRKKRNLSPRRSYRKERKSKSLRRSSQ
jgi:hypothetical protein